MMFRRPAVVIFAVGAFVAAQAPERAQTKPRSTLVNPLLSSGPDPWLMYRAGSYYLMCTTGNSLAIWKTSSVADLSRAKRHDVWRPPRSGPYSRDVWAPELHFLRGKWYIYFAADAGTNASHRIWVVENSAEDPVSGKWQMKGKVSDPSDRWAIDATVFEDRGRMYMVWSGWETDVNVSQNLYIAELSDPWTVKGQRTMISSPVHSWEKVGDLTGGRRDPEKNPGADPLDPIHVDVNEGPELLRNGNRLMIVYSAGGCWTDYASLGMLTAESGSNLLDSSSWKKSPTPVFWQSPHAGAYGPGHPSFFDSPDGMEHWMAYHANPAPNQGCGDRRSPRAQPFTWRQDGTPDFGRPARVGQEIAAPAGETK